MTYIPNILFALTRVVVTISLTMQIAAASEAPAAEPIRLGIIGLDTSHAIAFTKLLNEKNAAEELANCRVVAAYPKGSPDIESSVSRVPRYTQQIQELGVEIVDSIDQLLGKVDGVLLETNDGRPHLEQIRPVLAAGKPVFVDKPLAGTLADSEEIFAAAQCGGANFLVIFFAFHTLVQDIRGGAIGQVLGCDAYSPCSLEKTHPDLFWYGIHGVELLFTVMGPGCESVVRSSTNDVDVVVGIWSDGRIGTFRGIRSGKGGYGGTAFGSNETRVIGPNQGYRPLVVKIVEFFRTGKPPIAAQETLEIYAFMEAADESKRRGGSPVRLDEVMSASTLKPESK